MITKTDIRYPPLCDSVGDAYQNMIDDRGTPRGYSSLMQL